MNIRATKLLQALAGTLVAALVAGCGGGGGGGGPPAALNIATAALADGVVGVAYSQTIAVTGGTGARSFTISAGALPAGLALNATTGAVTGTPAGPAATASFTITVTDAGTPQQTDSQALTLDIVDPLVITTATLPGTSVGAAYNQSLAATGGTLPYTFSIGGGSLPAGIVLGVNGALTGPATAQATSQTFTVVVTDSSSPALTATLSFTIAVTLEIVTTSLPDAAGGEFYSQTLQAQGGLLPRSWRRTAGSMPAGIADPVAATGTVSGTPDPVCAASTAVFTAEVSDSATPPATDTQAGLAITVNPVALNIATVTLPAGVVGAAYNVNVQTTGGVPPYNFAVTNGSLPSQLGPIVAASGQIAGTPDTVESRTFDVTVTDACAGADTQTLSITINAASPGRNDSISSATALGNGTFAASISPSGNPNTVFDPDEDYYAITTTAASTVTVDINAQVNGSPLDPVIEIVGANGVQLSSCVAPAFNSPCEHDDIDPGIQLDSILEIRVGGATTFYVHVVDFRGDARPDLLYDIVISGVN